ncbi:hepatic lectin-like isoform X1 [Thunnus thynnus]|uniref:hepatic lectin-like isoform X1 n=2 Tax=Thunnus thynnus TaxID=8237 RepID=UPI003529A446
MYIKMAVAFNSKAGEIGGDGWKLMDNDERPIYEGRSKSSVWCIGAATVGLGLLILLLLAVTLGLVAHNTRATSPQGIEQLFIGQTACENLTLQWIQLQKRYNMLSENKNQLLTMFSSLAEERDALKDERDQLMMVSSNLTKEMELLQSRFNTVVATRDELQEEANRLNLNRSNKLCPQDWKKHNNKCYYVSETGLTKNWERSKKDCEDRGAHLVIITTEVEQQFVTRFYDRTWIGLSDRDQEGKWKWVDGTGLVGDGFWQEGEPNDHSRNEDCVEVSRGGDGWNDVRCSLKLSWVCEGQDLS